MTEAVLSARRDAGGALTLVTLEVDGATARGYTTPGQYVEVKSARGNGYFVLAGPPGAAPFELLVRTAGDAAEALVSEPLGAKFDISTPLGLGFPIDQQRRRPLVVAVVGSALAVARPILRGRIAEGDAAATQVFLGTRAPHDVPLADEIEAWAEAGVHVVLCLSRAELHHEPHHLPRASRLSGYVQTAVAHAVAGHRVPRGALIVAAGPEPMLAAMRDLAAGSGGAVQVVTNV